jgi:hypothetical protein
VSAEHEYYKSFAEELLAKFRRVGHLVEHPTTTGSYHEALLRSVLGTFLSRRFSVGTGFVYASPEQVSDQVDILVVDENDADAYVYREGDLGIVRPRSVVAAIEVKTVLGVKAFDEGLQKIASVRKLICSPKGICTAIFGYESPNVTPSWLDKLFVRPAAQALADTPHLAPELVLFLRKGLMLLNTNADMSIGVGGQFRPATGAAHVAGAEDDDRGWQLEILLAMIHAACLHRAVRDTLPAQSTADITERASEIARRLAFAGAVPSTDAWQLGAGRADPPVD